MAVTPVTPVAGKNTFIAQGGTAVIAVPSGPNGGFIVNPIFPADQALINPEPLYVDPVYACPAVGGTIYANGTVSMLQPGQVWDLIPGQTTPTYVNALSTGHQFTVVWY